VSRYLFFVEGVVKGESMVLYIFGYPINLVLRLMDFYLGIRTRNGVYLSTYFLLFENRSLADAHRKLGKLGFTLSSALEM